VDLAPDGKRIVAPMPATEAKGAEEVQNRLVFLENFFDELRRKVPAPLSGIAVTIGQAIRIA